VRLRWADAWHAIHIKGFIRMRLSCVFALGLALFGTGAGAKAAAALDVQRNIRHTKPSSHHLTEPKRSTRSAAANSTASRSKSSASRVRSSAKSSATLHRTAITHRRHRYYERFTAGSFAKGDIFEGDVTTGEDPLVRQAAIDALDGMNGTAVVINPSNGRVLAMVNQKLALSPGAEPCSTIKVSVALTALGRTGDEGHAGAVGWFPHEHDHRPRQEQQSIFRGTRQGTWL
jgi:hypothetical protein